MNAFSIRTATVTDAPAVSQLITGLAHAFTLNPDGSGAERFLESITPAAIAGFIANPDFRYLVAERGGALAGAAALREGRHLYHLFVAPAFQRRGVAARLWQALRAGTPAQAFTVNSTPVAVPVYERFGFVATGPQVSMNGIVFVPMRLETAGFESPAA
jgi:GNAT superfamily N-acetyltransferase